MPQKWYCYHSFFNRKANFMYFSDFDSIRLYVFILLTYDPRSRCMFEKKRWNVWRHHRNPKFFTKATIGQNPFRTCVSSCQYVFLMCGHNYLILAPKQKKVKFQKNWTYLKIHRNFPPIIRGCFTPDLVFLYLIFH